MFFVTRRPLKTQGMETRFFLRRSEGVGQADFAAVDNIWVAPYL